MTSGGYIIFRVQWQLVSQPEIYSVTLVTNITWQLEWHHIITTRPNRQRQSKTGKKANRLIRPKWYIG